MILIEQFIPLAVLILALLGAVMYRNRLRQVEIVAPRLMRLEPDREKSTAEKPPTISVIIPAYNEAENIAECVTSVLESADQETSELEVWVVDDQSTDRTWAIVETLQQALNHPQLHALQGQPRPATEVWMGKNWACTQGAQQATGDYLLFLDADVRLQPGAIAAVLDQMQREPIDLLTLCPAVICSCLGEWLIQPLIIGLLATGYDFTAVNDPDQEAAFAVGQFMLFRRSAYDTLGGHRAVAGEVVEDVELARLSACILPLLPSGKGGPKTGISAPNGTYR
jgi:glycosyltransferase involved in cell wall biosynthesis